jgi:hypothetical protein
MNATTSSTFQPGDRVLVKFSNAPEGYAIVVRDDGPDGLDMPFIRPDNCDPSVRSFSIARHVVTLVESGPRVLSDAEVESLATLIMHEIDTDIRDGRVPADIADFCELDEYVDRNAYADGVIPDAPDVEGDDFAWFANVIRVQDEVDKRLHARAAQTR